MKGCLTWRFSSLDSFLVMEQMKEALSYLKGLLKKYNCCYLPQNVRPDGRILNPKGFYTPEDVSLVVDPRITWDPWPVADDDVPYMTMPIGFSEGGLFVPKEFLDTTRYPIDLHKRIWSDWDIHPAELSGLSEQPDSEDQSVAVWFKMYRLHSRGIEFMIANRWIQICYSVAPFDPDKVSPEEKSMVDLFTELYMWSEENLEEIDKTRRDVTFAFR